MKYKPVLVKLASGNTYYVGVNADCDHESFRHMIRTGEFLGGYISDKLETYLGEVNLKYCTFYSFE